MQCPSLQEIPSRWALEATLEASQSRAAATTFRWSLKLRSSQGVHHLMVSVRWSPDGKELLPAAQIPQTNG